jgi:hypothetical protein
VRPLDKSLKKMNKKYLILISILILFAGSNVAYGQINICEDKKSNHPMDNELLKLKDNLQVAGVDTIIVYSHWIYTNGFNGYGKIIWRTKGENFLLQLDYNKETSKVDVSDSILLMNDSTMNFFFDNQLDTIHNNPEKNDIQMSHDGRHFISIEWGENRYCFTISNLVVQFNPENERVQWINYFKKAGM